MAMRFAIGQRVKIAKYLDLMGELEDMDKLKAALGQEGVVKGSCRLDPSEHNDENDVYEVLVNGEVVWPTAEELEAVE